MHEALQKGKFREDLYYRLNTISIHLPPLRKRKDDINLLFRKFANDFAEKYSTPPVELEKDAAELLQNYYWPGNVRQLKNFVAQISVIEKERNIDLKISNHIYQKTYQQHLLFLMMRKKQIFLKEKFYTKSFLT